MNKTLTIELALANPRQGRPAIRKGYFPGGRGLHIIRKNNYDVVVLRKPLTSGHCPDHYQDSFFETLDISSERKDLLRWVAWYLCEYFSSKGFTEKAYDISESYAYFALTDEQEKTTYSTPHITSPVLFDPNDRDGTYELGMYQHDIKGPSFFPRFRKINLIKRVDLNILQHEEARRRVQPVPTPRFNYKPVSIINSLLNYYENTANANQVKLKSIYEEASATVFLPSIFSLSSYELRSFLYKDGECNEQTD